MPNVILIHGYNGKPKVFNWLEDELNKMEYNVVIPEFPAREKCRYINWKNVLNKYIDSFNENTIVIAHSIGNVFFLKYVYENKTVFKKYIGLAGFCKYFEVKGREDINIALKGFMASKEEIKHFKELNTEKYSIYSNNDHIVPFDVLEDYSNKINADPIYIEGIGHMGNRSGIERIEKILELVK